MQGRSWKIAFPSRASPHTIILQDFIFKNFPAGRMRMEGVPPVAEKLLIPIRPENPSPNFHHPEPKAHPHHCRFIIFFKFRLYLHTYANFDFNRCSMFNIKKGSHGRNHSLLDSHHPIKKVPLPKFPFPPPTS